MFQAGTDDGYINIFDIYEDELVYNKLMDKQEGKWFLLCYNL